MFKQDFASTAPLQMLKVGIKATMQVTFKKVGNELCPSKGIHDKGTNEETFE